MIKTDPPPPPDDKRRSEMATLEESEIVEKARKGEIRLDEMSRSEREKYGKYCRKY